MNRILLSTLAAITLLSGTLAAGEKQMMHCFAFTAKPEATPAEWDAFYKATDAIPSKMSMVKMVWVGKLRSPLAQYAPDPETRKQFNATTDKGNGGIVRVIRQYGACFAFDGPDSLKAYAAHPYHAEWMSAYEKVRVAGTTTYDILGQ